MSPVTNGPTDDDRRARWPLVVAIALTLAMHGVGRVGAFCSPIHADSYVYASIGYRIANGEVFYRDMSDVKPPGLYLLYAAAYTFLPAGRPTMIPVDTLFGCLGYWGVYLLGKTLYGRRVALVIMVTSALAINFFTEMDFATDAFGLSEIFMVFPAAMAARHYLLGLSRKGSGHFFWCGLWVGFEFIIKQTVLPLLLAVAIHWTVSTIATRLKFRRWINGTAMMVAGGFVAVLPFVALVIAQGTWRRALDVLGPNATRMLNLETAWPTQWSDVLPLWVPMAWCAFGLAWWIEARARRSATNAESPPTSFGKVSFLLVWIAAECVMLVYLPLRAYHYYVISCLPLVILSGLFWAQLSVLNGKVPSRYRIAGVSFAALLSIAFFKPVIDTMVPAAIARYRSYDADADRAYFDKIVSLGEHHFGAPPPTKPE